MSNADWKAAHQLSGLFTERHAFDQPGHLIETVDQVAADFPDYTDETMALGLVLYAQNAAWNGSSEGDRAAEEVAAVLAAKRNT